MCLRVCLRTNWDSSTKFFYLREVVCGYCRAFLLFIGTHLLGG